MKPMIIGIAGGTGSGKTTITKNILEHFRDDVSVVYHDNYYRSQDNLSYEERKKLNFDHPDAFETALFLKHLQALSRGEAVLCPVYDYSQHNRSEKTVSIIPAKVILVEGILVLHDPEICSQMDIKLFVDADADERILRRIMRDVKERQRSLDSVVDQYLTTVKPMHEQFVEPSKKNADIIIPKGGHNLVAMDFLMSSICRHIEG